MAPRELPSGIVSFVLTDIEGSTRLLRRLGDLYDSVLERHRSLLREAWLRFGGHEVSTSGDSFFVAFADAGAAIEACIEGQHALQSEEWPSGGDVKVRMGVHSGLASPHSDDYVALAVHQAARVMSAAHGGQVLVSDDTVALIRGDQRFRLTALGRFRLRDFDEPVPLYAVGREDVRPVSKVVRALPADGHNLTRPPNAFVGRVAEVAEVASRLQTGRVLTLVGPGGVGKTRLAIEAALGLSSSWDDGVWLVDVSPLRQPSLVVGAVIEALGVVDAPGVSQDDALLGALESKRLLLVLDNCEHLVGACASIVESIMLRCPSVAVMATSRTPLGVLAEQVLRVGPLGLPTAGSSLDEVRSAPSVQLLSDRAGARGRGLEISEETAEDVVELCAHLDGLPLAIELAAARLNVVSPGELVRALDTHAETLSSSERYRPERQRSLRQLLDWSYDDLSGGEQATLRRLSLFGSSFGLESAARAATGELVEAEEAPDMLWSLVDKSLVRVDLAANATRYRLLETVRNYASEHLQPDEAEFAVLALADLFLEELGPWQRRDRAWLGQVAIESDNIRALLPPLAAMECERAQLLACTIGRFHDVAHSFRVGVDELSRWAEELEEPTAARVVLLATLADLQLRLGDTESARAQLDRVDALGALVTEAAEWDDAAVQRIRGDLAMRTGDVAGATRIAEEALATPLSAHGRARMWNLAGIAAISAGDFDRSADAFREELALCEELDDVVPLAADHGNLAEVAMRRGDFAAAAREQLICLQYARELGLPVMVASSLIVSARLGASESPVHAARLHSKADQILRETGAQLYDDDRRESDEMLASVRAELGDGGYEDAVEAGKNTDLPSAVELAMELLEAAAKREEQAAGRMRR